MVPDTPVSVTLRPLAAPDATAARVLADVVLGGAPFAEAMRASLDEALTSDGDEYRAIGVHDGNALIGFVVFGEIAGALGAGRIYFVAVEATARRRGIATALIEAACSDLRSRGSRFAVIELLEELSLAPGRALAHRTGFRDEGRVSDYVRDGAGLLLLRRDLIGA
jgi:ribosomal protein S18 acetylase RimI-like enzyme